ncbi:MAG: hypothetical protein AB7I35_12105 [Ramlibacter sp.]
MTTELAAIQKRAAALSEYRDKLSALFITLQGNLDTVKNGSLPEIKRVARQVAKEHNELVDLIRANPELFEKPRSYVVDGIKFGMQKQPGSLTWDDDAKVVERIRRMVEAGDMAPEQAELLINTTEKPAANALGQLDERTLKRLGVRLVGDGDEPLVKSVDSNVEKAVTSVINAAIKEANAEA